MPQFLHSGPSIAGISNQPPAILTTIEYPASYSNVTVRNTLLDLLVLLAVNLRKVTGARDILVEECIRGPILQSHLHFPTARRVLRPLRQPDLHHTSPLFPISLRKLNQPTNISTRESSSDSRDQTHLRNCDSGLVARAKITIATPCYCVRNQNLLAYTVSLC